MKQESCNCKPCSVIEKEIKLHTKKIAELERSMHAMELVRQRTCFESHKENRGALIAAKDREKVKL